MCVLCVCVCVYVCVCVCVCVCVYSVYSVCVNILHVHNMFICYFHTNRLEFSDELRWAVAGGVNMSCELVEPEGVTM